MNTIQIPLYKPVYSETPLTFSSMYELDGNLHIVTANNSYIGVSPSSTLYIRRTAPMKTGSMDISAELSVIQVKGNTIITERPEQRRLTISDRDNIRTIGDENGNTIGIKITFDEEHHIFLQDLLDSQNKETPFPKIVLSGFTANNEYVGTYSNLCICKGIGSDIATESDLYEYSKETSCVGENLEIEYTYLPYNFDTSSLILSGITEDDIANVQYFIPNFNEFYYTDSATTYNGTFEEDRLYCHLWKDTTEYGIDDLIAINKETGYWNISTNLDVLADENSLGLSDMQHNSLLDKTIEENIPSIIDMERIKYVPVIDDKGLQLATAITINPHFRQRTLASPQYDDDGNLNYDEGWYIDETRLWNGMGTSTDYKSFMEKSGNIPDLLGYLNFTDNDAYYQKSKIKGSFIRLSFYNSNDPLSNSLLFYSTVFLDSGEIYGKYIKQLNGVSEGKIVSNHAILLCDDNSLSGRVDSQFTITNEYDSTKSAEGFNIYLFNDDIEQNNGKTIYMKVEFNHGGVGKTIPLIDWPKDNEGEYTELTIDNYLKSLYIPVKLGYINNRYFYYFPNAMNENGNIIMNLYEPKLSTSYGLPSSDTGNTSGSTGGTVIIPITGITGITIDPALPIIDPVNPDFGTNVIKVTYISYHESMHRALFSDDAAYEQIVLRPNNGTNAYINYTWRQTSPFTEYDSGSTTIRKMNQIFPLTLSCIGHDNQVNAKKRDNVTTYPEKIVINSNTTYTNINKAVTQTITIEEDDFVKDINIEVYWGLKEITNNGNS